MTKKYKIIHKTQGKRNRIMLIYSILLILLKFNYFKVKLCQEHMVKIDTILFVVKLHALSFALTYVFSVIIQYISFSFRLVTLIPVLNVTLTNVVKQIEYAVFGRADCLSCDYFSIQQDHHRLNSYLAGASLSLLLLV